MKITATRIGWKKILSLSPNAAHTRYNKTGKAEDSNDRRRVLTGFSVPKITHSLKQSSGSTE